MGVRNIIKRAGQRAGDTVSKLAVLSPNQVEKVQQEREAYLLEEPDPSDEIAVKRTERLMAASSIEIFNAYLPQIKDLYLPVKNGAEYDSQQFDAAHNIRYINITKWVTDKQENNLEKLVNVYAVLSNEDCNIALIFNRTRENTDVYVAVVNTKNSNSNVDAESLKTRLVDAIRGNFPGAEWNNEGLGILPCLDNDKSYSVATASNIPTEKSEKFISQTIEKLLDGIVPDSKKQEYTIILLATPILDVEERKLKLGEFYSGLAPYSSWTTDYHYTENESIGSSATMGVNIGASAGIQNGQNYSETENNAVTDSKSEAKTKQNSQTDSDSSARAKSNSAAHSEGLNSAETETASLSENRGNSITNASGEFEGKNISAGVNANVNVDAGFKPLGIGAEGKVGVGGNVSTGKNSGTNKSIAEAVSESSGWTKGTSKALGETASDTLTKGLTNTISKSVAKTTGTAVANTLGKAVTKAMATTSGVAKNTSFGANFGANFARSSTVTSMIGKNEGITQTFTNFNIKHALELLESQMKRLEQSSALGLWDFAAYVLSEDQHVANNVAHSYLALTLGEESYMSKSAINVWKGNVEEEKATAKEISSYLRELRHPVFALNPTATTLAKDEFKGNDKEYDEELQERNAYNEYPSIVTATTSLSGKELAYSLNFPQKSVSGLPVIECAEFGRNIVTYEAQDEAEKIQLGKIFHMNHVEKSNVELTLKSLASHTFITGSTGSGKSNTIYHMLHMAKNAGVKFLVVEPAKGEYKHVFGCDGDVSVYGTNPKLSPLLRMNPFSFPDDIHVLEHIDRLVEIFNVCWPMYAAMPAVLKHAVEKAYIDCGWDLVESANRYDNRIFPDFADVARNIRNIIDSSEYDAENKGAYKGSLLTRLQSLSTGINALIFTADELSDEELFDSNVIIDLSRVGSVETKSLIMGMLVLKLQEYRMTSGLMNAELRHFTVLEEAHNLLRKTSTEQSTEGSNLMGKSVEMLANAIAEMRTYGEGFIIADQAPGLMDMSVIRNTNTKIIMRLPDQGDRELVGKAANLNDEQITELSKLPCGVAAIYQNEWIQPVLCKVSEHRKGGRKYIYNPPETVSDGVKDISDSLLNCIMDKELFRRGDKQDLKELKDIIIKSGLDSFVKVDFIKYLDDNKDGLETLRCLVYDFLKADKAIQASKQFEDIREWVDSVVDKLDPSVEQYSKKQIDLTMALILNEQSVRDVSYRNIYHAFTEAYKNGGGVF